MPKIGLQLYTIGSDLANDFEGTLRSVAAMGYDGVEFAGTPSLPSNQVAELLGELGLAVAGIVAPMHELADISSFDHVVSYNLALGSNTVLFPWLDDQYRGSGDAYRRTGELLATIGRALGRHGLKLHYHTHGYEFEKYGETTGLDIMMAQSQPDDLGIEIDTYWVERNGVDSLTLYKQYASRCRNIHFKDYLDRIEWRDTEVGDGLVNFASIIEEASGNPLEWFVVEQEQFSRPPMESASIACANLRRLVKEHYGK